MRRTNTQQPLRVVHPGTINRVYQCRFSFSLVQFLDLDLPLRSLFRRVERRLLKVEQVVSKVPDEIARVENVERLEWKA
jgi:hypothetical protein